MFEYFWWNIAVVLIGSFAIYWMATQKHRSFSAAVYVLVLSILLGFVGYTRFGQMHNGNTYHFDEIYVYYLGSKYYKENSQKYLFVSIVGAIHELGSTKKVPVITSVRNLEQPFETYSENDAQRIFIEKARLHFTSKRWEEFKQDVSVFLDIGWSNNNTMSLADVGYNPPPTFALIAGSIASFIKLTPGTITFLPFIDWTLVLLASIIVLRTFGFLAAGVFLLIYLNNNLCGMYWIGGGFCRHLFFFSLTMAICALDKRRYFLAGIAFGFATAFRIFPFVFLFGACLPFINDLCKDWRKGLYPLAYLLTGALLTLSILLFLTLLKYPFSHWIGFFDKIFLHNKTFFVMHLGYDKIAAMTFNTGSQYFDIDGISTFENWNILLNDRFNEHWMLHRSIALLFTAGAIFASFRMDPKLASLLAGETILFFYALPANYYYIYLATFGVVVVSALKESSQNGNSLRFWALMGFIIFINFVGGFSRDTILLNWWINLALLILLFVYITSQLGQIKFNPQEDKHQVFIVLGMIFCLGLITFKPRQMPSTNTNGFYTQVLLFNTKDVISGSGWLQDDHKFDPHWWPTKVQLVVRNQNGSIEVGKHFTIPQRQKYLVTINHSSNADNVQADINISCVDFDAEPMSTITSNFIFGKESYVCTFPAGSNSIKISGKGNAKNSFLGLNSIILKPL